MSNKIPKSLFIKALEDIRNTKKLGYATIARLTGMKTTKIYNIMHGKSTAKISDIQNLLAQFPEYKALFSDVEGLELPVTEIKYDPKDQDLVSILNEKIALYEETKTAQRETIESLKEEIIRLKEIVALQRKLIEKYENT